LRNLRPKHCDAAQDSVALKQCLGLRRAVFRINGR
jgi:hypothetical protein